MERYGNRTGKSGVVGFEVVDDAIEVEFVGGECYRYGERAPGRAHVANMRRRARMGRGLATYISRFVGDNYEEKLDAVPESIAGTPGTVFSPPGRTPP